MPGTGPIDRAGTAVELWRLMTQGLRAAALLAPSATVARPLPPAGLLFAGVLYLVVGFTIDLFAIGEPREFNPWALAELSFPLLLALFGGGIAASLIGRPALWLRLAAIGLVAALPLQIGWALWPGSAVIDLPASTLSVYFAIYGALVAARVLHWAAPPRAAKRTVVGAGLAFALVALSLQLLPGTYWWWPVWPDEELEPPAAVRDYSAEALLYAQPALLADRINALAAQRPGRIDLYAIGFGGDGNESVFRNEIEHFERLMAQRFDAGGRTIGLLNHPDTLSSRPLATLTNLHQAIAGVATVMDRDEDVLLLFLTSHGSQDHELMTALHDLPLDPVRPADLERMLEAAGVRWRILIVSACYSGGFIEPLQGPGTLIMTAARADRPSFGCGWQSEITWFGQALMVDALNTTRDFVAAFEAARQLIADRERLEQQDPSEPQLSAGSAIVERLQQWRSQLPPAQAVPWQPAVPTASPDLTGSTSDGESGSAR